MFTTHRGKNVLQEAFCSGFVFWASKIKVVNPCFGKKPETGKRVRMSQVIVAQSIHGIILAVERPAIQVNEGGEDPRCRV